MRIDLDDLILACAAGDLIWDRNAVTYRVRGEDIGASIQEAWQRPSKVQFGAHEESDRRLPVVLTAAGMDYLAELTPEPLTHQVVIAPSRPGFLDWRCSCGEASGYDYGSFGRAADAAVEHVRDDESLIITRPSLSEGGADHA